MPPNLDAALINEVCGKMREHIFASDVTAFLDNIEVGGLGGRAGNIVGREQMGVFSQNPVWVWVKIKPPGIGLFGSVCPGSILGTYF